MRSNNKKAEEKERKERREVAAKASKEMNDLIRRSATKQDTGIAERLFGTKQDDQL